MAKDRKKASFFGQSLKSGVILAKRAGAADLYAVAVRADDGEISVTARTIQNKSSSFPLFHKIKKLLSIILVGQVELKSKLDESRNWEAREVIRRMEVLEIEPLGKGADVAAYLDVKFARLGRDRKAVIDDGGCEALAAKLRRQTRAGVVYSVAFPLLVNNWARRAMNEAARLGAKVVDAEVVNAL